MARRIITTHPVNSQRGPTKTRLPHYCMPGLNTSLMNSISESNEAVQFYSVPDHFNLPVPYVTLSDNELIINPVMDPVNLKIKWKFEHDRLLNLCREKISIHTLNDIKSKAQTTEPISHTMPLALTSFTSNLMENPDKYFDSEYNWYFKNTIAKFQNDGKWYLACARGENLNILDIVTVNNDNLGKIENRESELFQGPIFDIKSSISNELMIRQKTKLFIFWNNSGIDTLLNNNSIYDNCDVPLADADISTNNLFCTADVKHFIKLWKDRDCIQNKYFEIMDDQTDSFTHLSYLQDQTDIISIISRQKLYLIDTRTDVSKPCSTYDSNTIIDKCEELTTLKSSSLNTHSVYVASNHSVLTLDTRMGFAHKSHHMLSNPPSLITSHCYDNSYEPNEMLFLGNQIGEDFINLSYTSFQDDILVCQNMASSIPKPLDSLHKVRLQGHCLNPMLVDRFTRCLIGSTAVGDNTKNLRLFSINSAGDLFVQNLNDNSPIDVAKFEKLVTIKSKHVSKLHYSEIIDMSNLWKKELPESCEKNVKLKNCWSMPKKKMTSFVDHLAPLILSPWDVDDLSEWEIEEEKTNTDNYDLDSDCISKVHYWFNKNDLLSRSAEPSQSEPNSCSSSTIHKEALTSKTPPSSENDENSSSGYTLSLQSDDT